MQIQLEGFDILSHGSKMVNSGRQNQIYGKDMFIDGMINIYDEGWNQ